MRHKNKETREGNIKIDFRASCHAEFD